MIHIFKYLIITYLVVQFSNIKNIKKYVGKTNSSCNSICNKCATKGFTNLFCPWMSSHRLYNEGGFSCEFTIKCMCQFGMSSKKLNPKDKHKMKRNNYVPTI